MWSPSPAEINAAIAAGHTVTAVAADLPRKHQPNRGAQITVTEAFEGNGCVRVTAEGFRGRFRAERFWSAAWERTPSREGL